MLVRAADAWKRLDEDPELRVGILTGAGGDFCSGMDLKALAGGMDESTPEPRSAEDPDLHWKALLRHFRPSQADHRRGRGLLRRRRHRDPPGHRDPGGRRDAPSSASPRCGGACSRSAARPCASSARSPSPTPPTCCSPAGSSRAAGGQGDRAHRPRRARRHGARQGPRAGRPDRRQRPAGGARPCSSRCGRPPALTEADGLAHELDASAAGHLRHQGRQGRPQGLRREAPRRLHRHLTESKRAPAQWRSLGRARAGWSGSGSRSMPSVRWAVSLKRRRIRGRRAGRGGRSSRCRRRRTRSRGRCRPRGPAAGRSRRRG